MERTVASTNSSTELRRDGGDSGHRRSTFLVATSGGWKLPPMNCFILLLSVFVPSVVIRRPFLLQPFHVSGLCWAKLFFKHCYTFLVATSGGWQPHGTYCLIWLLLVLPSAVIRRQFPFETFACFWMSGYFVLRRSSFARFEVQQIMEIKFKILRNCVQVHIPFFMVVQDSDMYRNHYGIVCLLKPMPDSQGTY